MGGFGVLNEGTGVPLDLRLNYWDMIAQPDWNIVRHEFAQADRDAERRIKELKKKLAEANPTSVS